MSNVRQILRGLWKSPAASIRCERFGMNERGLPARNQFAIVALLMTHALIMLAPCVVEGQTSQTPQPPQRPLNPTQEVAGEVPAGPSIAIGPAELRVGGYLGLTGLHRSTNGGGGTGTSFAALPYADTLRGNVSE